LLGTELLQAPRVSSNITT